MNGSVSAGLRPAFYPERVAVIGVNETPDRVGFNVLQGILEGGFGGEVYPVHPRHKSILGKKVYKSIEDVPGPVDAAVICLNQHATVEAAETCGRLGVKALICHAGGYREMGEEGLVLEARLSEIVRRYGMALVGPNSLGLINNDGDFYSTFYPLRLPKGSVSIISQSGGVGLTIMHRAIDEGIGINKFVGVGNCSTTGFADYLEYFAEDSGTSVIAVFMEGAGDARRFVEAAGRVVLKKPVVVLKAGRSEISDYFTVTHTGSAAGSYRLYRDIFNQFGILSADSVSELLAACKGLSMLPLPRSNRVGIITHTAGPSIIMSDILADRGCVVPSLQDKTIDRVKKIIGEDPPVVLKNPLDAAGLGFMRQAFGQLAGAVLEDDGIDILMAVYCLHKNWGLPSDEIIDVCRKFKKPVIACYASHWEGCREDREMLQKEGIPLFTVPEDAAAAAAALVHQSKLRGGR